jgi:hypothetical protein
MRRVLYMATVAGIRSNPAIKAFYLRIRATAKQAKQALVTWLRKLLLILNAMLHNKTHWQTPAPASLSSSLSPLLGPVSERVAARTNHWARSCLSTSSRGRGPSTPSSLSAFIHSSPALTEQKMRFGLQNELTQINDDIRKQFVD